MAALYFDVKGNRLSSYVSGINGEILEALGLGDDVVPYGFMDFDVESGLVKVLPEEGKDCITMRMGKYLKRIGKSDEECTLIGGRAKALKIVNEAPIKFATTEEEIIDVYARGPKSCMKGETSVRVYAVEGIAVAYLEIADRVIARSVVNTNDKLYGRTYGMGDPLTVQLDNLDYSYSTAPLEECYVQKIEGGDGDYVMAYIDGTDYCEVDGDYILLGSGNMSCQVTEGYTCVPCCDCCGKECSEYETYYSEYYDESLCESCMEERHVLINGEWYAKKSDDVQELEDGDYVLREDACHVEYRDEWHHRECCVENTYDSTYILKEDIGD